MTVRSLALWVLLAAVGGLTEAQAAPKRDRVVSIHYVPGSLGHGVRVKIEGVEAQLQKKTAFVWLSRGDAQVMSGSEARLTFRSRNWKSVRVRLRPKRSGVVTLKRTALLSGPADVNYSLEELGKKTREQRYVIPSNYETEAFNVLYRTLLLLGSRPDMVVRFRKQLNPKGDLELKADPKRFTVDFSQLRPTAVGHLAAMAVLTRQGLVREGVSFPVPTQLAKAMNAPSGKATQMALVYLYGRAASNHLRDSHRPTPSADGHRIPLNVAGLLRDLSDRGREPGPEGTYDSVYVPKLRSAIRRAYSYAQPRSVTVTTPFGSATVPVPGSGNPIKGWSDLIQRLDPAASQQDAYAVLRLNGFSSESIVW